MHPAHRRVLKFNPRALFVGGVPGGFWDVSDRKTLWQNTAMTTPVAADGDPVGALVDKSGNGNHLLAAADDTTRPTYKTGGGLHWLEFDGTNDLIGASFTIAQPWDRISALQQITWTINERIFAGVAANSGLLFQTTSSPTMSIFSGVSVVTPTLAVGADGVVAERHSGTASRVSVNNGPVTTGSAGTTATDGLRVGAIHGTATSWSNIRFYGGIMRHGAMTETQIGNVRRYFATRAGVAL